ncbi:hypothetical protein HanRHA438_Chr12g0546551 [Helianthus annuus]|nr:hypothetical protein HanRHA438_Chr12g0546551 [Helianthus annuus]
MRADVWMLQIVCFLADLSLKKVCETSSPSRHVPSSSNLFQPLLLFSLCHHLLCHHHLHLRHSSAATTSSATTTSTSDTPPPPPPPVPPPPSSLFNTNQLPTSQNPPQNQEREGAAGERERRERDL